MAGFAPAPMQHDGVASALDAKASELGTLLRRAQELVDELDAIADDASPRAHQLLDEALDRVQMHSLATLHSCVVAAATTHREDNRKAVA